jgi:hypothetical protein
MARHFAAAVVSMTAQIPLATPVSTLYLVAIH